MLSLRLIKGLKNIYLYETSMTNKFDTQGNDYKAPEERNINSHGFHNPDVTTYTSAITVALTVIVPNVRVANSINGLRHGKRNYSIPRIIM